MRSSRLRSFLRGLRFLFSCLFSFSLYAVCGGPLARFRRGIQANWCRSMLRFSGFRVTAIGEPSVDGPTLYVSNHLSYMDIPVLASVVEGTFVAKAEVATWPLFGFAARITNTVFINRVSSEARAQRAMMHRRLMSGERLILFPEGTSTDGSGVAPFKSALFSLAEGPAEDPELIIQPISLAYTRSLDGTPLVGPLRELYCWFGDASLFPHLMRMLGLPGCRVEVRFHAPIHSRQIGNRKQLARVAEAAVAAGVAASNAPLLAEASSQAPATPGPLRREANAASA
jgi:1-acyl-sn-glycerol-3-phosphate acyltransferase